MKVEKSTKTLLEVFRAMDKMTGISPAIEGLWDVPELKSWVDSLEETDSISAELDSHAMLCSSLEDVVDGFGLSDTHKEEIRLQDKKTRKDKIVKEKMEMQQVHRSQYFWCNSDGHDKVYALFWTDDGGAYGVWGKRGGNLSTMKYSASKARDKEGERNAKGYRELRGSLTDAEKGIIRTLQTHAVNVLSLELTGEPTKTAPVSTPPVTKRIVKPEPVIVAVKCIDDSGVEDHFQIGVEYILVDSPSNKHVLIVEDMLGKPTEVLASRFTKV